MTTVDERIEQILDSIKELSAQSWPVADLVVSPEAVEHFVLAEDVKSPVDLPRQRIARINGYAGKASELSSADPETPLLLDVSGDVTPDSTDQVAPPHRPDQVWRVAAGAPMPDGADTVVPLAHTDRHPRKVQIRRPAAEGAHVWNAGDGIRAGDVLAEAGDALAPGVVASLIAAEVERIEVLPSLRVGVVSASRPVTDPDDAPDDLDAEEDAAPTLVPDPNGPMIAGAVRMAGHRVARTVVVDSSEVSSAIRSLKGEADLIVVTSALGGGPDDILDDDLPGKLEYVDVDALPSIAPGFATVGFGKRPVIALPGDPTSARIAFELFVRPALERRSGHGDYTPIEVTALAKQGWTSSSDLAQYVPIRLSSDVSGGYLATPSDGIAGLVGSDGIAVVGDGLEEVRIGDEVSVRLLRPLAEIQRRLSVSGGPATDNG